MIQLFNAVLYQPILNLLVFIYNIVPGQDIGIAIIVLTVLIKLILYPFSLQSIKAQKAMKDVQPKIEELKKKHKDQKDKLAQEMMLLYKKEKINPMSSCLPLLIQLPFLLAVFRVFRTGLKAESLGMLYPFVHNPGVLNPISFGFLDLSKPSPYLAVLAGAVQYWQAKMMVTKKPPPEVANKEAAKDEGMAAAMNKQMLYMMPVITVIIGMTLPGGLALYWFVTTLLMVLQQYWFFKKDNKKPEEQSQDISVEPQN